MKKFFYQLILIFSCLILQGCPIDQYPTDMSFTLCNKSDVDVTFYINVQDTIINMKDMYKVNLTILEKYNNRKIDYWTEEFEQNKKLNVVFLKKSTLDAYSWEEIQEKNLVDKRYVLSLEELKAMNYTVVYDGK